MTWNGIAINALTFFGKPLNKRGGIGNLTLGLSQRFALFQRHELGEIVLVSHHEIKPAAQDNRTLFGR